MRTIGNLLWFILGGFFYGLSVVALRFAGICFDYWDSLGGARVSCLANLRSCHLAAKQLIGAN